MSERLRLKGALSELKFRDMELVTAAKSHISAIKEKLADAVFKPLEQIEADKIAYHADELLRIHGEHKETLQKIVDIEKELA